MSAGRARLVWCTVAAVFICYFRVLAGMADQWWSDEDMGHGFVVPLVIAFVLWRERARWSKVELKPSAWGWALLAIGACIQVVSTLGAGLFAGSLAMLISVIGAILCFGGFPLLRAWTFPLLLSLFMLPKLAIVYNKTTLPLQLLASRMAAGLLTMSGVGVIRSGNILDVGGHQVAVAEACSGVRYLLPLAFIGVVIAYVSDARPSMRLALLLSAIPVATLANAVRVAISAYSPKLAEGNPHFALGALIFVLCLGSLFLLQRFWTTVLRTADV